MLAMRAPQAIDIRRLSYDDVRDCAALHGRAFPNFFLSRLGEPFLRELYAAYVHDRRCVALVAQDHQSGALLGAVLGTAEPAGFFRRLVRRRWWAFAFAAARLAARSPSTLPRILRAALYRGGDRDLAVGALLSSIAVEPSEHGTGVGTALIKRWEDEIWRLGATRAYLTTDRYGNDAVNRFYARAGWVLMDARESPEGRWLNYYHRIRPGLGSETDSDTPHEETKPVLRVLHVVGASNFGGASRVVCSIGTGLGPSFETKVLTTEPRLSNVAKNLGFGVVPEVEIVRSPNLLKDVRATYGLIRHLRTEKYDIVHTHTSKGGVVGRVAAWVARVPVRVHTIHNFAWGDESSNFLRLSNVVLEWGLARLTTHLTVVSNVLYEKVVASRIARPSKVACIVNGVPDSRYLGGVAIEPQSILFHGRLAAGKGIEDLIAAIERLKPSFPNLSLRLVGEGELRPWLAERLPSLGFGAGSLPGFVEDVDKLLMQADICVQPSYREGLSIALLESLRNGCCIVASDISANVEVLQGSPGGPDAGILFPVGNVAALADALVELLKDEARRASLRARARRRYESTYTEVEMQRKYLELYLLLSGNRGTHEGLSPSNPEGGELDSPTFTSGRVSQWNLTSHYCRGVGCSSMCYLNFSSQASRGLYFGFAFYGLHRWARSSERFTRGCAIAASLYWGRPESRF